MIIKLAVLIFFIVCLEQTTVTTGDSPPCGDWEQYKDEHCYKLFDGVQSYSDSEKICQKNNSTLVSIHYAEEQNFLTNYIFTKKKIVDNVWIGAKYIGNKQFQWEDKSILSGIGHFNNWAPENPKNLTDHCVEMLSDENLRGKWTDERCEKKNIAICQRLPEISIRLLAETIVELKHSLQQTASKLVETESKLERTLNQTANTINNSLDETKKEVAQLKKENIPIGFIYVQLPKDKAPSELWPSMTWADLQKL